MSLVISRYDNLSTILVVTGLLVMLGFAGQLTKSMVAQANLLAAKPAAVKGYTRPPVQGYTRPPQAGISNKPKSNPLDTPQLPIAALSEAQNKKLIERFQEAVVLMHAKKYNYALSALDEVLRIVPSMPEAYVNMGYALFGLKRYDEAAGAFRKAIDLRPFQANAYYGLASVLDAQKDYEAALGAMRSFIHLSRSDADKRFLAKARSAIWEWQGLLGRIKGVKAAPAGAKAQIDEYVGGVHKPDNQATPAH